MKFNKILAIIFVLLFVVLIGIVIKQQSDIEEIKDVIGFERRKESKKQQDEIDRKQEEIKKAATISKEDLIKHIEKVELTTENWKDYFEIYTKIDETKDGWGEIIHTSSSSMIRLKEIYANSLLVDAVMDIEVDEDVVDTIYSKNKRTISFENNSHQQNLGMGWENVTTEDITCTRIKGILYYIKDFDINWYDSENDEESSYIYIGNEKIYEFHFDDYLEKLINEIETEK